MKAVWMKVLSLFLVLVLVANMLPMGVFAQQVQENADAAGTDVTEEVASDDAMQPEEIGEAEIVNELTEKRNAYTKSFRLDNGLNMAVTYADAVHYETETGWKEIDNTLKKTVDGYYTNTAGDWDVRFPRQLSSGNVEIERDGYTLSFSLSGALHNDNLQRSVGAYRVDKAKTSYGKEQQLEQAEPLEHPQAVPQKNHSQLAYTDVYQNTDVIYDLVGNQVKESIVLESYDSSLQGYTYALNTGDMLPVLEEDGQITLYDPAKENVILVMPAPYLLDDANAYCNDVQVQLTGSNGSYTLTYLLPKQWLAAEERTWPVVLDPIVTTELERSNIRDVSVAQNTTSGTSTGGSNAGALSCGVGSIDGETRFFVKYATLPELKPTETIIRAEMELTTLAEYEHTVPVEVHKVNSAWESESTTWNNQPACNSVVEDYNIVGNANIYTSYTWIVTDIVRDWYSDSNTGMMFQVPDSIVSAGTNSIRQFCSADYGTEGSRPTLYMYYLDRGGIESRFSYQTMSAGHAGTAHIADATGQLTVVKNIATFNSTVNPFDLNLVYNSFYFNRTSTDDDTIQQTHGIDMRFGNGFTMDCIMSMEPKQIENAYGEYLVWHDGDGTDHYFVKQSDGTYLDEDGLNLTVEKSGNDYTMTDDQGNQWLFTDGLFYKYQDESGNTTVIEWKDSGSNRYFHRIYQQNNGITYGTDLVNVTYVPNTNYISSLTDAAGRVYSFSYANDKLVDITLNGEPNVHYAYNSETGNRLVGMKDMESGYQLWFEYYPYSHKDYAKVMTYQEWADTNTSGAIVGIEYKSDMTVYRDYGADRAFGTSDDLQTYYTFDYFGRTINASTKDASGRVLGVSSAIITHNQTQTPQQLRNNNRTLQTASTGMAAQNLLTNGSFESGTDGWTPSLSGNQASLRASNYTRHSGYNSLEGWMSATHTGGSISESTSATLTAGTTYTLSAYVDTSWIESFGANGGIRLIAANSNYGTWYSDFLNYSTESMSDKWTRISVTFTPTATAYYTLMIQAVDIVGWFYADDFQLEEAEAPSNYNLIQNGNMNSSANWQEDGGMSYAVENSGNRLLRLQGDIDADICAWQNVKVMQPSNQTYVLSGWAWADSVPDNDNAHTNANYARDTTKRFGLQAILHYVPSDATDEPDTEYHYAPFYPDVDTWQFTSMAIVPKQENRTVQYIQVVCAYEKNANVAWFDNISLVMEAAQTMTYDADGNLKSVTTTGLEKAENTYDNGNLMSAYTGGSGTYTYTYDDNVKHRLITVTDGTVAQVYGYDSYGNVSSTTLKKGDSTLRTAATYTYNGNLLQKVTDANGDTVEYAYGTGFNKALGLPSSVTDGNGTTSYTYYDDLGRTTSSTVANVASLQYTYTKGLLTKVSRNNSQNYSFNYDIWGNRTHIYAGDNLLASYTYADKNGNLTTQTYGNGDKVSYTYDNQGRVKTAAYSDTGRILTYTYTGDGQLYSIHDSSNGRTVCFNYDTLDRLIGYRNGQIFTTNRYNSFNQLIRRDFTSPLSSDYETYTYDTNAENGISDGTLTSMRMVSGGTINYQYDGLQRLTNKDIAGEIWETFVYDNTQVSSKINYLGDTRLHSLHYLYDSNGNITKETLSEGGTQNSRNYTYDKLNQLLEVKENGAVKESYAYDNAGNIKTFNNGSTQNHTLAYEDTRGWKDLLTAVDGEPITYDKIGNPLTYYDGYKYTFDWTEGRRLQKITYHPNETTQIVTQYEYDYTGLRTKKLNHDGTYTTYHIADGRYLGETQYGTDNIPDRYTRYIYDESDSVVGISLWRAGYSSAWEDYYFLKNLQGDVLRVYKASNNSLAASYTYDAWGNIVASQNYQNFDGIAVSQLNPFRYRGYYFDNETYFYYLQSRYYDPAIGRFINADGFVSTGQGVLGFNMFAYCGNNAVVNIDSFGTRQEMCAGGFGGSAYAGGGGVVSSTNIFKTLIEAALATALAANVHEAVKRYEGNSAKSHTVYGLKDPNSGRVEYVGRTTDPVKREAAHKRNPARQHLEMFYIETGLTAIEARGVEQIMMLAYHTINVNDKMNNQINGISPSNPNLEVYMAGGREVLSYFENQISNEILYWTGN